VEKVILLVEDDKEINQLVKGQLEQEAFKVVTAYNGEDALHLLEQHEVDLILLDLMLPKLGGMEVLKRIRATKHTPVLIISAKGSDLDKALGLGFGADDYISKPFSLIELVARVHAAIRRSTQYAAAANDSSVAIPAAAGSLQYKELTLDMSSFTAQIEDRNVQLTAKEFQILKLFMTNPRRVFTKEQIFHYIWEEDYYGNENVINVHIRRLREKVELDPSNPQYIRTIWGIGYKLGDA